MESKDYILDFETLQQENPGIPAEWQNELGPVADKAEEDFRSFIISYLFM